ncbi:MAG TPA: tail-specific protease, partial [Cytophagales bacterium]|nr:tail-specific protease [Cytophagales bacterium]
MKKLLVLSILVFAYSFSWAKIDIDTVALKPKPVYGREAKFITYILDTYNYRKITLNDSLSNAILQQYLNELDNSRMYFLA